MCKEIDKLEEVYNRLPDIPHFSKLLKNCNGRLFEYKVENEGQFTSISLHEEPDISIAKSHLTKGSEVPLHNHPNSAAIKTAVETIQGQDFLIISDTAKHDNLDCTMIYVMTDAVFASIEVDGVEIIDSSDDVKGLDGVTVVAGTLLPFGKEHATSITLTSGTVIAYIN